MYTSFSWPKCALLVPSFQEVPCLISCTDTDIFFTNWRHVDFRLLWAVHLFFNKYLTQHHFKANWVKIGRDKQPHLCQGLFAASFSLSSRHCFFLKKRSKAKSLIFSMFHKDPELRGRAALILGDIEVLHTEGHPDSSGLTLPCPLSFLLL